MRTLAVLWTPFTMGILLLFAHLLQVSAQSDTSGPVFIQEPPNQMDFSNTTGTEIICQSRGTPMPQITWVKTDGSIVQDVPGLRKVLSNGNLVLPPFRAEDYNQEVHAQTYRCIAENSLGKIQSRDVQVRAVVSQSYTHEASNEYVIIGNDALFKCEIPSFVADSLEIAGWVDSDGNEYTRQFTPQTNRLQQVVDQPYETRVGDEFVIIGNDVHISCDFPGFASDFLEVLTWHSIDLFDDPIHITEIQATISSSVQGDTSTKTILFC